MAKAKKQDDEAEDKVEGEDGEAPAAGKKRLAGKKIVLFAGIPVLVLLLGLGGAFAFGAFDSLLGKGEHDAAAEQKAKEHKEAVFYDLPELLVNLSAQNSRTSYLKLRVALEIEDPEASKELEKLQPRVIDNFQVYLRELRIADLDGSAGMFRLKEELLARVNVAVAPVKVNDVLFKEMLVQ
jgi:flagellar FliL protein